MRPPLVTGWPSQVAVGAGEIGIFFVPAVAVITQAKMGVSSMELELAVTSLELELSVLSPELELAVTSLELELELDMSLPELELGVTELVPRGVGFGSSEPEHANRAKARDAEKRIFFIILSPK